MNRLRKFLELSRPDRFCLMEAGVWLGLARLALLFLPFRWLAWSLDRQEGRQPAAGSQEMLGRLAWALATASRHLPWDCTCLTQALAGKAILNRRGAASTLFLGMANVGESVIQAHAWLRCGETILTGRQGLADFTVIATIGEGGK